MRPSLRSLSRRRPLALSVAVAAALALAPAAQAAVSQVSSDPYTQATCKASSTTNHKTEVEPDSFANGSTIVAAYQVGRIYDGGACATGFATSTDNGASWTNGLLPGITKWFGGGPNDRATDASVAYDASHNVWLISSLTLLEAGGVHGNAVVTIATIRHHRVAGSLREGPLPSAEIDGAGTAYVAWADCRFRQSCRTNDIVLSHSLNATGTSWSSVARVPIDATNSRVDHFIPGLAVNKATAGSTAKLGLTYYFYPSGSTQLSVGFVSSTNAGSTWSTPTTLASGMPSR